MFKATAEMSRQEQAQLSIDELMLMYLQCKESGFPLLLCELLSAMQRLVLPGCVLAHDGPAWVRLCSSRGGGCGGAGGVCPCELSHCAPVTASG